MGFRPLSLSAPPAPQGAYCLLRAREQELQMREEAEAEAAGGQGGAGQCLAEALAEGVELMLELLPLVDKHRAVALSAREPRHQRLLARHEPRDRRVELPQPRVRMRQLGLRRLHRVPKVRRLRLRRGGRGVSD